jgi:hypothetical protein
VRREKRDSSAEGVEIEAFIKAKLKDPAVRQQLNSALRELGLAGEFREGNPPQG